MSLCHLFKNSTTFQAEISSDDFIIYILSRVMPTHPITKFHLKVKKL